MCNRKREDVGLPGRPRRTAFTLLEVVIVIALIAVFVVLLLPSAAGSRKDPRIHCVGNLKHVGMAFREWENENGGFPMQVYTNQSGTAQFADSATGFRNFQVMSNELATPYILFCREDKQHTAATNFNNDFNRNHISYFIGLDATDKEPQAFLAGDSDIVGGKQLASGVVELALNQPVSWSSHRHRGHGNVLLVDGSVSMFNSEGLFTALQHTGLTTNRFLLPQ